jgi:hypothetical protein
MTLTVYTADWSGPCRMLRIWLNKGKVKHTVVDIDGSSKAAKDAGVQAVPTIVFSNPGENDVRIIGFGPEVITRIKEELNISE